jgi:hypothetical protein
VAELGSGEKSIAVGGIIGNHVSAIGAAERGFVIKIEGAKVRGSQGRRGGASVRGIRGSVETIKEGSLSAGGRQSGLRKGEAELNSGDSGG